MNDFPYKSNELDLNAARSDATGRLAALKGDIPANRIRTLTTLNLTNRDASQKIAICKVGTQTCFEKVWLCSLLEFDVEKVHPKSVSHPMACPGKHIEQWRSMLTLNCKTYRVDNHREGSESAMLRTPQLPQKSVQALQTTDV